MAGGETYWVFKVLNTVTPTSDVSLWESFKGADLEWVVDANGDGSPGEGDVGITWGGDAVWIGKTEGGITTAAGMKVDWHWLWDHAGSGAFPAKKVTRNYQTAAPAKADLLALSVEETLQEYNDKQMAQAKAVASTVSEHPIVTTALVAGVFLVQLHPYGRTANTALAVGGQLYGSTVFIHDKVDGIIHGTPMGEQDLIATLGMIGGAAATEGTISRMLLPTGPRGGLVLAAEGGYGRIVAGAVEGASETVAAEAGFTPSALPIFFTRSGGKNARLTAEEVDEIFRANAANDDFHNAFRLFRREAGDFVDYAEMDFIKEMALHGVRFDRSGRVIPGSVDGAIADVIRDIRRATSGEVGSEDIRLAEMIARVVGENPERALRVIIGDRRDVAERVETIKMLTYRLRTLRVLKGLSPDL